MHFAIWRNTFYNLEKYILKFGEIHFAIWGNIFSNLGKYILQLGEIHLYPKSGVVFCDLAKFIF